MPWEPKVEGVLTTPNGRLALCFQVSKEVSPRLEALLEEAKERELWKYIFGSTAFTVKMIPTQRAMEDRNLRSRRPKYVQMVQTHGSIMLSLGLVCPGLINFGKRCVLRRVYNEENNFPAITKSTQDIIRYARFDGKKVWILSIPGSSGAVTAYFFTGIDGLEKHIQNWILCPPTQIFWFSTRKGYSREDLKIVVKSYFAISKWRKTASSRFSKKQGCVIVTGGKGSYILNVVDKSKAYHTHLGISVEYKVEKNG